MEPEKPKNSTKQLSDVAWITTALVAGSIGAAMTPTGSHSTHPRNTPEEPPAIRMEDAPNKNPPIKLRNSDNPEVAEEATLAPPVIEPGTHVERFTANDAPDPTSVRGYPKGKRGSFVR